MWPDRVSNPGPPTYESGIIECDFIVAVKELIVLIVITWASSKLKAL